MGADWLRAAIHRVVDNLGVPDAEWSLERPRDPAHGDLATNVALQLAKPLKRNPRELAQEILAALDTPDGLIASIEIAGPGFINFRLTDTAVTDVLRRILDAGETFGRSQSGAGRRVNVEFVSANPTGPLHVGHGRGAALGDAISSLLEATGHSVEREFYINDAGVQIDRLAQSLWSRVQQQLGRNAPIPDGGYHGEYLTEVAQQLIARDGSAIGDLPAADALERCKAFAVAQQREEQDRDLADFGVRFDVHYRETSLYEQGLLEETLKELAAQGLTYERDDALWLKTSTYGDTKDRVLRKGDGTYTYFLPDIAYHRTKRRRGFDRAIDVWGADHHGYIPRMTAALVALGMSEEFFHVVLVQLVRVMRHGEEVRFSKRAGDFVSLRELYQETGVDAARYFFLMRRGDAQFVFDIDLATTQSEENPVYYVQYAHTRMAGIFRTAAIDPATIEANEGDLARLTEPEELELIKLLGVYPTVVAKAATALEPHRVIVYLEDLAHLVNGWYHRHRVLGVGEDLEHARLALARGVQIVLANALHLLGITAPERM